MTLRELCAELFAYLIDYREKVAYATGPSGDELRSDLDGIFQRQREEVRNHPSLSGAYQQVLYALAVLCDEVILTAGGQVGGIWGRHLLEERFFGSNVAGDQFFERLNRLQGAPAEVLEIYYLCLTLGFSGRYQKGDPQLESIQAELLHRLGWSALPDGDRLFPEAYAIQSGGPKRLPKIIRWRPALLILLILASGIVLGERFVYWPWSTAPVRDLAQMATSRALARTYGQDSPDSPADKAPLTKPDYQAEKPKADRPPQAEPAPQLKQEPAPQPKPAPESKPKPEPQAKPEPKPALPEESRTQSKSEAITPVPLSQTAALTDQTAMLGHGSPAAPPEPDLSPGTPMETGQAEPASLPQPDAAGQDQAYWVQAGVFAGPQSANRAARKLEQARLPVEVLTKNNKDNRTWHVLIVGPYENLGQAEQASAIIKDEIRVEPLVIYPQTSQAGRGSG